MTDIRRSQSIGQRVSGWMDGWIALALALALLFVPYLDFSHLISPVFLSSFLPACFPSSLSPRSPLLDIFYLGRRSTAGTLSSTLLQRSDAPNCVRIPHVGKLHGEASTPPGPLASNYYAHRHLPPKNFWGSLRSARAGRKLKQVLLLMHPKGIH